MSIQTFDLSAVLKVTPLDPELELTFQGTLNNQENKIRPLVREIDQLPKKVSKYVLLVAIIPLGSVFVIMAAHQISPLGVNAISQINPWGYAIGYGLLGGGVITIVTLIGKTLKNRKDAYAALKLIYDSLDQETDLFIDAHIKKQLGEKQVLVIKKDTATYTVYTKQEKHSYEISKITAHDLRANHDPTSENFIKQEDFKTWIEQTQNTESVNNFICKFLENLNPENFVKG